MRKCVGCGYCCIMAPCVSSLHRWGVRDCPALVWNGERYVCEMAGPWGKLLQIGEGCIGGPDSWRRNVRNRDDQRVTGRRR